MYRYIFPASLLLLFVFHVSNSDADIVSLSASDTATVRPNGTDVNNYNRLVAYDRTDLNATALLDGFVKFDLSAIPDSAQIDAMTLTIFLEYPAVGLPEIQLRRSSHDSWVRGGVGFPTVYDETLTPSDSGPFPTTRHDPYVFNIDTNAVNWSNDLTDDTLTLILNETSPTHNDYIYWYGSDGVTATGDATVPGSVLDYVPTLTVEFTPVPEPTTCTLALAALCVAISRRC